MIQGKPDKLFKKKEVKSYILKFKDKTIKLGHVSEELIQTLREMNKYAIITADEESKLSPLTIPEFPGLVFGRSGDNTTITIASDTEENLTKKVNDFTNHLSKEGIITSERCHWVCVFDKAKQNSEEKIKKKELDTSTLTEKQKAIINLGNKLLNNDNTSSTKE